MEEFSKMLMAMANSAEQMRKELEDKESALKKKEDSLAFYASRFKEGTIDGEAGNEPLVELNVGGRIFVTLRPTLLQFENTYFTAMLSGKYPVLRDNEGRVFLDRSPSTFALLLTWMRRGGYLTKKERKYRDLDALLAEVEYFGLTAAWEASIPPPSPEIKLYRVQRAPANSSSSWGYSGSTDRLKVTVSKTIMLYGLGLWGAADSRAVIDVTAEINGKVLVHMSEMYYTQQKTKKRRKIEDEDEGEKHVILPNASQSVYDIIFPHGVKLKKDRQYCLSAKITGGNTLSCSSATPSLTCKKVRFTFSKASSDTNGTSETGGQFPCLLWAPMPDERDD